MATVSTIQMRSVLEEMRELSGEIRDRAEETERGERVPDDLLDKIQATGAFRMSVPRVLGGYEYSVRDSCDVIEEAAAADASTAWHIMVAIGSQVITSRLPFESLRQYYAAGPDVWPKAALAPKGVAVPVEGGYRLSGRWPLASGARTFHWVSVGFFIKDTDGSRRASDGRPDFRCCLLPAEYAQIVPTWDAVGLRGTRSDDIVIEDAFVAEAWQGSLFGPSTVDAPAYRVRMPIATGPYHIAVQVGVLRAAIADLASESLTRRPAFNPTVLMKDDPVFRSRFGEIAARFEMLRAMHDENVAVIDKCGRTGRDLTPLEGARISAGVALIGRQSTAIMDDIIGLSGTGGVYNSNPQQRRWRDLRCAAQHQAQNIGLFADYAAQLIAVAKA